MTFWIGAPLSKWRSYEVRLWAKNAPLRCIIVSKNAPKFLIKPEAPCSKSLHKPLVSRGQGGRAATTPRSWLVSFWDSPLFVFNYTSSNNYQLNQHTWVAAMELNSWICPCTPLHQMSYFGFRQSTFFLSGFSFWFFAPIFLVILLRG